MNDSRPIAMSLTDAERIKRLERIVEAARKEGSEESEVVEIVREFMKQPSETNNKVWWLVGSFGVCAVIGMWLASEVISQGKELAALKQEVSQCLKRP